MDSKTKKFDAVTSSRLWKEAVARDTEKLSRAEVLAYFDREAVRQRFQKSLSRAETK
jgi:hypothetical protein